jgi:septal ring-binding cell division protein DamX
MGFFDSKSKQESFVENNTLNTSENLNVQDAEGIVVGRSDGNVTIVSTDHNAIGDASALAQRSVDFAQSIGSAAMDLSLRQTESVLDYQRLALNTVADNSDRSLSFVSESSRGMVETVSDTVSDLFGGVISFVKDLTMQSQHTVADTVASVNSIATENSKSVDQRLAETSGQSQKYMLIGVGILALAVVAVTVFKKGS